MDFYRAILAGTLLTGSFGSSPALAEEPVRFMPSGGWVADFADGSCALQRQFEHSRDQVRLEFRKFEPGGSMTVTIASKTLGVRALKPMTRFLPDPDFETHKLVPKPKFEGGWTGVIIEDSLLPNAVEAERRAASSNFETVDRVRSSTISGYEIRDVFADDLELMTGSLDQAEAVMRTCMDDLVSSWGLDPAVQDKLQRRVQPTYKEPWWKLLGRGLSRLPKRGTINRFNVHLLVDDAGTPTTCSVIEYPDPKQSGVLCGILLKQARFAPALDANSRPVKSYLTIALTTALRGA